MYDEDDDNDYDYDNCCLGGGKDNNDDVEDVDWK